MENVELLCECNGFNCRCKILVPLEIAQSIQKKGLIIIASDCLNGPSPSDVLIAEEDGYALYKEK